MSLYAELRRGPVRAYVPRSSRSGLNNIYSRLNNSRHTRHSNAYNSYNRQNRTQPRASSRDLEFEKRRMTTTEAARITAIEKAIEEEEEKSRMEAARVEELRKTILMVDDINLHVYETTIEHHTDLFDCTEGIFDDLVVRRGQEFRMTLTFQRPFLPEQDDLYLHFKIGDNPNPMKGTSYKFKLEEGDNTKYMDRKKKKWGARILSQHENTMTVAIYIHPKAIIGVWEYSVITEFVEDGQKKTAKLDGKKDITILLNPWSPDDQVYLEDYELLNEYVLNEHGVVFKGSKFGITKSPWQYGQINSSDDDGVLVGNWTGNYFGGRSPVSWRGSIAILEQYYEMREPVKFGQCWVFSHLLTTVARALGLPCRSITNFSSSHDTNLSMTIDKYYDDEGNIIEWKSKDTIWNFHVWNEVWINRPDLDKLLNAQGKYSGFHAIDATPQELSDSMFQCGPSPLEAIRYGDIHVGYDTKFIFAEVNADLCRWRQTSDEPILLSKNSNCIGKNISTKTPNGKPIDNSVFAEDSANRLDITHLYKHPEGSVAEREAVMKALEGTELSEVIFKNVTGIEIDFQPIREPKLGDAIKIVAKISNKAKETRSVRLKLTVRPMTYWGGVIGTECVTQKTYPEITIEPDQVEEFTLEVEADKYIEHCDEQLSMTVLGMAVIRGFDNHENRVYNSDDFNVQPGKLDVQGPQEPVTAEQPVPLVINFTNPTNKVLTECVIELEGGIEILDPDFKRENTIYGKKLSDIGPHQQISLTVNVKPNIKPKKSFEREVEVGLICKGVPDFEGCVHITLKK